MLSDEDSQRLTRDAFAHGWNPDEERSPRSTGELIARELDGIRTELREMRMRGLVAHVTTP